ncbi:hypothetical protein FNV43_RR27293 [Rhamnella rubrinervis]|uniref:Uncharacterized protein n=1 Tax=Rhamnella rubrinervis TaxID=2594499 RepID=A0A8K0GQ08_9ROSA|nr:hypothetical protein FNV43_RR27293 [Rhamnella rubrinervis]
MESGSLYEILLGHLYPRKKYSPQRGLVGGFFCLSLTKMGRCAGLPLRKPLLRLPGMMPPSPPPGLTLRFRLIASCVRRRGPGLAWESFGLHWDALTGSKGEKEILGESAKDEAERGRDVKPNERAEHKKEREAEEEEVEGHQEKAIDLVKSSVTIRREYNILLDVTLWVPEQDEVPSQPHKGEIAITIPTFYYGLRVPFPAFVRKLLQETPIHPVQLSYSAW